MKDVKATAKRVSVLVAAIAAVNSYGHQYAVLNDAHAGKLFGVIPYAILAPLTVDALAYIGLLIRGYGEATRGLKKAAIILLLLAGSVSLSANLAEAQNVVQVVMGAWTVVAALLAESFVAALDRAKSVEEAKAAKAAAELAAAQAEAARVAAASAAQAATAASKRCAPGCTCGKHSRRVSSKKRTARKVTAVAP